MKYLRIVFAVVAFIIFSLVISYSLSGGPTVIANQVQIQKSQAEVFDFISDMHNELKWNPDVLLMEKISEGPIGLGTQFRAKWHMSDTLVVTITQYDRPNRVTFTNGGPVEVTLEANLSTAGSTTEMNTRFIATPHGFLRAIFPIFKIQMEKQEKENMVNLKKALEQ